MGLTLIDRDELLTYVDDLSNDMWHPIYGVTEYDIDSATVIDAIETDWLMDYAQMALSGEALDAVMKMIDAWYEEQKPKHKRPTLQSAYNKGVEYGINEFRKSLLYMKTKLEEKGRENAEQKEASDSPTIQE